MTEAENSYQTESDSNENDDIDYTKTKIYKLINNVNELYYIGSTVKRLIKRYEGHKNDAKRRTSKAYNILNEIGWEHIDIELIEECPYITSRNEKSKKEQEYLDIHMKDSNCINTFRAYTSPEEKKEQKRQSGIKLQDAYNARRREKGMTEEEKSDKQAYDKKRRDESKVITCPICFVKYKEIIKSRHIKTEQHKEAVRLRESGAKKDGLHTICQICYTPYIRYDASNEKT